MHHFPDVAHGDMKNAGRAGRVESLALEAAANYGEPVHECGRHFVRERRRMQAAGESYRVSCLVYWRC